MYQNPIDVIPAQAGIQNDKKLDSCFRRNDVYFLYTAAVNLPDLFNISNDISESVLEGKFNC